MDTSIVKICKGGQLGDNQLWCKMIQMELNCNDALILSESKFKRLLRRLRSRYPQLLNPKKVQTQGIFFHESLRDFKYVIPHHIVTLDEKFIRNCLELINIGASKGSSPLPICLGDNRSGNVDMSMAGEWIVGTVSKSQSMINILKSPLFCQYGSLNTNEDEKEQKNGSETGRKRFLSFSSSTNSSSPDRSSTSSSFTSPSVSQGMVQCTMQCGTPQYVFSTENPMEIYVAKLLKLYSDAPFEYNYLFHRSEKGREASLVGKMKVKSSFLPCTDNNSKILETEFVLFGAGENYTVQTSNSKVGWKGKGLGQKFARAFRVSKSSFSSKSEFENLCNIPDSNARMNLLNDDLAPHLESIAIVARDQIRTKNEAIDGGGGWGLKFLKKFGASQTKVSSENSLCSESCLDVILPAGFHGGPRELNRGPCGLIQRWRSGGLCDCGGWDLGCTLKVLNAGSTKGVFFPQGNTFDLFIQGSDQSGAPALKMASMQNGLHFVEFGAALSALHCFSIAVAVMHMRDHNLRPRNMQD